MYAVSNAFKTAIAKPVVRFNIDGTIGADSFTKNNILQGTFKIVNQCSDDAECQIGSVYIGELSATFIGISLNRYAAIGKKIVPRFGLKISSNPDVYEYVPLGVYTIEEAEWSAAGLTVKAYDNMSKLDKVCAITYLGKLHDIAKIACRECGVELANANFNDFQNGTAYFEEYSESDIETYRDLMYWIAQTMGAFVTANRDGKIEFRKYGQTIVDTIDEYHRFRGAKFSDYVTRYTGMSVVNLRDEITKYYNVTPDDGLTYNLGANPFLQMRADNDTHCQAVLTALQQIQYVPFECTAVSNPAYDLGDVLSLSGGLGDSSKLFCVNKFELTYNGNLKLKGSGKNPILASVKSKTDKSIQGLLSNQNANEVAIYEYTNTASITIGENENALLCSIDMASKKATKAQIHIEVDLTSVSVTPTESYEIDEDNLIHLEDIWEGIRDAATKGKVTYMVDATLDEVHQPVESWIDGQHVLHLMYVLTMEAGIPTKFRAYLKAVNGEITIPVGGVWFFASGTGLVGEGKWSGAIEINETVADFALVCVTFDSIQESIAIEPQAPTAIVVQDNAAEFNLINVVMENTGDTVIINMYSHKFVLITEAGETFITEDGKTLVTEYDE